MKTISSIAAFTLVGLLAVGFRPGAGAIQLMNIYVRDL